MRTCYKSIIREFNKMGDAFVRAIANMNIGYTLSYRVEHIIVDKEEQHVKLLCTLIDTTSSTNFVTNIEAIDCRIQTSTIDGLLYDMPSDTYQKVLCSNWKEVKNELFDCCKTAWRDKILTKVKFECCANSDLEN